MVASCWERFLWELRPSYPFFSLEEAVGHDESSTSPPATTSMQTREGHCIDVAASFAPYRCISIPVRFFFLAWSLQVLYTDLSAYPPHNLYIYMGYLTHWGHLLSNLYLTCSFLCAICPCATRQPAVAADPKPGRLVRTTWGLYSCVAPLGIAITILYWSGTPFVSGHGSYVSVMEHGGIAALVLIDGLVVGLVPVRAKHVIYLIIVSVSYMTWSIIDAVLEIGNGEWGPAYEDDALYPVLNWNDDRKGATIVSAFVICVLSPCLFYSCWALSLRSASSWCRKILDSDNDTTNHGCCCSGKLDGSRRPLYHAPTAILDTTAPYYKAMDDNGKV